MFLFIIINSVVIVVRITIAVIVFLFRLALQYCCCCHRDRSHLCHTLLQREEAKKIRSTNISSDRYSAAFFSVCRCEICIRMFDVIDQRRQSISATINRIACIPNQRSCIFMTIKIHVKSATIAQN